MREVDRLGRPPHMRGRARRRRGGVRRDGRAPRAGAAGDVSGSQVTGGTRLRTHGSRIAAAFFAVSLVGAPAHAREPLFHPDWPITEPGALLPRGRRRRAPRPVLQRARGTPSTGETTLSPWASPRPVPGLSPGALPRASSDARALDVTWPVAPGCLSRPTGLRRRGAPHPGSHSGGTPSFARATDLGLPKTLGRLGKGSVIGFPNPRESSRPAVTTM